MPIFNIIEILPPIYLIPLRKGKPDLSENKKYFFQSF